MDAKNKASVESSDASAKNDMWLRDGREVMRLVNLADSVQNERRVLGTGSWPSIVDSSSLSNIDKSIMIDLRGR